MFRCFIGILPHYCPWILPTSEFQLLDGTFQGYQYDRDANVPESLLDVELTQRVAHNPGTQKWQFAAN